MPLVFRGTKRLVKDMPGGAPKGNKNHLKHGMHGTRIYNIWKSMRQRCQTPSCSGYYKYGARGISICEEWNSFDSFYKWAISSGYSDTLTIERIDVNGNYEPSNCTWIPFSEQAYNKRSTHWIDDDGVLISMAKYCKIHGLRYKYFCSLLHKGVPAAEARIRAVQKERNNAEQDTKGNNQT